MFLMEWESKTARIAIITVLLVAVPSLARTDTSPKYPETGRIMRELYMNGRTALGRYIDFNRQAQKEKLPEFARLFEAIAASQAVMIVNFERLITDLGGSVPTCTHEDRTVANTRTNLRRALEMEILETDVTYPDALKRIESDGYAAAIYTIKLALRAQRQHRAKMERMLTAVDHFYGSLKTALQERKIRYFVCHQTGAMLLDELPEICPVRGISTSSYRESHIFRTLEGMRACYTGGIGVI